jgi:hypothetical protein
MGAEEGRNREVNSSKESCAQEGCGEEIRGDEDSNEKEDHRKEGGHGFLAHCGWRCRQ